MMILVGIIGIVIGLCIWTKFVIDIAKEIGEDNAKKEMNSKLADAIAVANSYKASSESYKAMYESNKRERELQHKLYEMKCKDYERKCKQYEDKCNAYNDLCKEYEDTATKLDSIKTIELVDNYSYDEDSCIDLLLKNNHRIAIEKVIEALKAENLINNHMTIELTEDEDKNCYGRRMLNNGQLVNRKIYLNYDLYDDEYDLLASYINDRYDLDLSDKDSLAMFTFLHEFGHYIDSTLEHEEDYYEENDKLKDKLIMIDDWKERQIAYRQIPEEEFADKWAVDFMKAHFTELALA